MRRAPAFSRRKFLSTISALGVSAPLGADDDKETIIDIHQHTNYSGRTTEQLIAHQQALGVTTTVLLPAGKMYGLDAQCGGNDSVRDATSRNSKDFRFFANEIPYLAEAKETITSFLKQGAIGIGEQKFRVLSDSRYLENMSAIAMEFNVPILLHFWDGDYNMEYHRFHKTLAKFPKVNFIGHAQTFWGQIDANYQPGDMYPKGAVKPGGLTDKYLADYPNMYADMSAGSGLNAIIRDEDHYRGFMERHQDKLMFGSDCNDRIGRGPGCQGAQILAAIRRVAPNKEIQRKILSGNARKVLRLQEKNP